MALSNEDCLKLAEMLEQIPHLGTNYDGGEYIIALGIHTDPVSGVNFCKEQGGLCAFNEWIAMLKVTASAG